MKSAEQEPAQEGLDELRPYWTRSEIWKQPLPEMRWQWLSRVVMRSMLFYRRRKITGIEGTEHIQTLEDPFIFVVNHSQRTEAPLIPAILAFLRGGKRVHFLADWNFVLIPPVAVIYWTGEVIMLTRKSAKPAFLNVFKPLVTRKSTGFERARERLHGGDSVGVFPEGTVNRKPDRLLKGYSGAARLSLQTGMPIVPAGAIYAGYTGVKPVEEKAPLHLKIGAPIHPGGVQENPSLQDVRDWHGRMMVEIATLCGKPWKANSTRR